mmetsp:Transcript_10065/g.23698  ORF Transcript_10065/g.23698 Transcript_10065/m.23698 type:complete len:617 (-) Transcript_10065:181-2031(-)
MELSILDTCGLPDGSILSVRSGPTRRQSPLPCSTPFKLPAGPWPLRIDVLALLGKSLAGASLSKIDADGRCRVPLEARDGRQMSVTLQVFEGKNGMRPNTAPNPNTRKGAEEADAEGGPSSPMRRRDTEAEARAYLDRHRLHEFMHTLFELLLRERPADPYSFIAARFREAAQLEVPSLPAALPAISSAEKPSRSSVSTAPTSSPTVHREDPSPALTTHDGAFQVTVRNMRGWSLARIATYPDIRVSTLKEQLAASLGVPPASQQLLWWAETMPNDTTLKDHGVPMDGVTVHLVCGTRDPRLRMALSGSSDGGLKLWSLEDGELLRDFGCGGPAAVLAVSVHWESMRALTGCLDGRLQLWDIATGSCTRTWAGHAEEISALDVDWPGMRALSGACDGIAKLWNLNDEGCAMTLVGGSALYSLAVNWPEMKACGGLKNGLVRLWNLANGTHVRDINIGTAAAISAGTAVSAVAIDCVGHRAVSGLEDGHLAYWHFSPPEDAHGAESPPPAATPKTKVLLAHYRAVRTISARWTSNDSRALCGSDDGSLSLWSLDSQTCIARFGRHVGFVWTIFVDWSRDRALSGAFDGCLKLWDLRTGDCLRTLQGHSRPVRSIAAG